MKSTQTQKPSRRGAVLVLAALLMVVIFGFAALSVDVGYMTLVKQELQNVADGSSLGAARELGKTPADVRTAAKDIALANVAAQEPVALDDSDIELGVYDIVARTFTVNESAPNAVRVTARTIDRPLFFGPVIQHTNFDMNADSIAMLNPRDIVFVVDLSGSMNDDTEPCWATQTINSTYGPQGFPTIGNQLMQSVYNDFGYGTYPGSYQHVGAPLGVTADDYAYARLTKDNGPLNSSSLASAYRIYNSDDEATRKLKAYRWMIDYQIAVLMPNAMPTPNSATNYDYWEKYLDYVINDVWVGSYYEGDDDDDDTPPPPPPPPGPPTPPTGKLFDRELWKGLVARPRTRDLGAVAAVQPSAVLELLVGSGYSGMVSTPGLPRKNSSANYYVPTPKDSDEIDEFNNPNQATFPGASSSLPEAWEFKIGYITYVQYLMDWGRDRSPLHSNSYNGASGALPKTPLSIASGQTPMHSESLPAGSFSFPPREQPMHAIRRALIAAIDEVKTRNGNLQAGAGDNVAIITYDALDADHAPQLVVSLTSDYNAAMQACTTLQATSDIGNSTATEAGIAFARQHVRDLANGGQGRPFADDIIVLITDGVPNAITSDQLDVDQYLNMNASPEWYAPEYWWYNAPLMQAHQMDDDDVYLYAVGMGLGTEYDFMDRLARLGRTDKNGLSPRGSGNPAEYEQVLIDVINEIIRNPGTRIVE